MVFDASTAQHPWVRFVHDRNPFFLFSAACMMTGCFLLNSALFEPGGGVGALLTVLAVINVYEFALIGLSGLLVSRTGRQSRDARMLAAFETMFLADGTFSLGAIATIDSAWGWGIGAALLILGTLKLTAVMAILGLPHRGRLASAVLLQLAVLLAAPTIFRHVVEHHYDFLPRAVYAGCWVTGAVAAAVGLLIAPVAGALFAPGRPRVVQAMYLLVPFASVILHVFTAICIYPQLRLSLAHLTPVLLGLAVVVESFAPFARTTPRIRRDQVVLLLVAVLASVGGPPELKFKLGWIELSPLTLALTGAAATVLWMLWRYNLRYFCVGAIAMVGTAALAVYRRAVVNALERTFDGVNDLLARLLPKPAIRWGVVAVAAAFVFLGVGAMLSLRRRPARSTSCDHAVENTVVAEIESPEDHDNLRE